MWHWKPKNEPENYTDQIRKHLIFSGRVQEVGFRYRSLYFASELGLTGWVYNMANGDVEMEVQGDYETIEALLKKLQTERGILITHIAVREIPLKKESKFQVKG